MSKIIINISCNTCKENKEVDRFATPDQMSKYCKDLKHKRLTAMRERLSTRRER